MELLQIIVLAVCVGAFILCVGGGLMIVFERWEPRSKATSKLLVGGVLASAIGAVTPQAGDLFGMDADGGDGPPVVEPSAPPAARPTALAPLTPLPPEPDLSPDPSSEPDPAETSSPVPGPTSSPRQPPESGEPATDNQPAAGATVSCVFPAPERVRTWSDANLGPRPDFRCAWRTAYPVCVADLGARGAGETSRIEATECGDRIVAFRRQAIAPLLSAKGHYGANIDSAALSLRFAANEEEIERQQYLAAEIARLNGTEWDRFNTVSRKSLTDMEACFSARVCRVQPD